MMRSRDYDADYKAALIDEYESYRRGGRDESAKAVAQVLRDSYAHDVDGGASDKTVDSSPKLETTAAARPPEDTAAARVNEHVCKECGYKAKSATGLANHQRSHEDE